ncbi:MAG: hypothetical protein AB7G35_21800 [Hyphomicrobiaceae bacterium]
MLTGCVQAIADEGLAIRPDIVHKVSSDDDGYPAGSPVRRVKDNADAARGRDIVGGTAFFFARPGNIQRFDWRFVDEAGQVGMANLAAMVGPCATSCWSVTRASFRRSSRARIWRRPTGPAWNGC